MERLTKRVGVDEAVPICDFDICAPFQRFGKCKTWTQDFPFGKWERHCNDTCILGRMIDRLADYEDTGLTPEQVAAQKWIPVTERLPETDGIYIVRTVHGTLTTARFYAYKYFPATRHLPEVHRSPSWQAYRNVTHWMPLPQPPKEDAQ